MSDLGPTTPQNWYLLGPANSVRQGEVVSHTIAGHDLIVYRPDAATPLVAMAAHCAHMGCHLGRAEVRNGKLRCPLHYRLIDKDGRFAGNRDGGMRQRVFRLREYAGGLFVFLGEADAASDLDRLGLSGAAICYAGEHRFDQPWQALVANGLDIEHLMSVHHRKLLATPELDIIDNHELRLRYVTKPTATKWHDLLMARLAPNGINGVMRSIGGTMFLVETRLERRETFILMSFLPQQGGGTLIRGLVGMKGEDSWFNRLSVRVARALFKAFLFKDLAVLENMRWHEPSQIDGLGDEYTRAACDFFRKLPSA